MKVIQFDHIKEDFQSFFFFYIGIELIEAKEASRLEIEMKEILGVDLGDDDLNIIINVLTKINLVFGKQPFIDRSLHDPLFLYVNQMWFEQNKNDQHRYDIPFLLNGWTSIITQWLKLDYQTRRQYIQQINDNQLNDDDDDD